MTFGLEPYDFLPFFGLRGVDDPMRFSVVVLISTVLDWFVMRRRLQRSLAGELRAGAVLEAVAVGFVSLFLKIVLVVFALRKSAFGAIFMTWCWFIFAVAPIAIEIAIRRARRTLVMSKSAFPLVAIGLLIWPCAAYARFVEPFRLTIERAEIRVDGRGPARSIRIGVLADLQTDRVTAYERRVVDALLAEKPDLILLPGDLFHGIERDFEEVLPEFNALLSRIDAPLGAYFVTGDVDPWHYVSRLLEGTKIRHLDNEVTTIEVDGVCLVIAGLCAQTSVQNARLAVTRFATQGANATYRVAFAHHPDQIGLLENAEFDVFVCGHTHGGQIALPFFGPPMTLTGLPRKIAAGGLHEFRGRKIYVSRGAGLERTQAPRIRFLCPPEISILTLGDGVAP